MALIWDTVQIPVVVLALIICCLRSLCRCSLLCSVALYKSTGQLLLVIRHVMLSGHACSNLIHSWSTMRSKAIFVGGSWSCTNRAGLETSYCLNPSGMHRRHEFTPAGTGLCVSDVWRERIHEITTNKYQLSTYVRSTYVRLSLLHRTCDMKTCLHVTHTHTYTHTRAHTRTQTHTHTYT